CHRVAELILDRLYTANSQADTAQFNRIIQLADLWVEAIDKALSALGVVSHGVTSQVAVKLQTKLHCVDHALIIGLGVSNDDLKEAPCFSRPDHEPVLVLADNSHRNLQRRSNLPLSYPVAEGTGRKPHNVKITLTQGCRQETPDARGVY